MKLNERRFRGKTLKRIFLDNPARLSGSEKGTFTEPGRLKHVDRFVSRAFMRFLPAGARIRFLDVGCSAPADAKPIGAITTLEAKKEFERHGAIVEAHGIDSVLPTLSHGKSLFGGVTYHAIDVEKDKLPPGQFDVVRAVNVLPFMKNPSAVVDRLLEKVRPGGILITSMWTLDMQKGAINYAYDIVQKSPGGCVELIAILPHDRKMHLLHELRAKYFAKHPGRQITSVGYRLLNFLDNINPKNRWMKEVQLDRKGLYNSVIAEAKKNGFKMLRQNPERMEIIRRFVAPHK